MDELSRLAAIEFRAERADGLFRQFVEQLHLAYQSDDPFDWMKAGSFFKRFKAAAIAADWSEENMHEFAGLEIEGGVQ